MEEVSEVEDCTDYEEDEESTDEEESEEEDPAETEENFLSKNETLIWSSITPSDRRRMSTAVRVTSHHGPTLYAVSRIDDIKSTFDLFLPKPIEEIVLAMTNKEGQRVWQEVEKAGSNRSAGLCGCVNSCWRLPIK